MLCHRKVIHGARTNPGRAVNLDILQWPAMVVTVAAAWLVTSRKRGRRTLGFWLFFASNGLWIAWGVDAHAYALVVLQFCLAALNVYGAKNNQPG